MLNEDYYVIINEFLEFSLGINSLKERLFSIAITYKCRYFVVTIEMVIITCNSRSTDYMSLLFLEYSLGINLLKKRLFYIAVN